MALEAYTCTTCGKPFTTGSKKQTLYCSPTCGKRHGARQRQDKPVRKTTAQVMAELNEIWRNYHELHEPR